MMHAMLILPARFAPLHDAKLALLRKPARQLRAAHGK